MIKPGSPCLLLLGHKMRYKWEDYDNLDLQQEEEVEVEEGLD